MSAAIINKLGNKPVGKIRMKRPASRTQHYECAAWYQDSVSNLGVFDLKLVEDRHSHDISLAASLPATVSSNSFQSQFGGVPCGKAYDSEKDSGKVERKVDYQNQRSSMWRDLLQNNSGWTREQRV